MSFFSLARLLLARDRAALLRLVGIVCGVAVGVALFLTLWGLGQGVVVRGERATWPDYPLDAQSRDEGGGHLREKWGGHLPDDRVLVAGGSAQLYRGSTGDLFRGGHIGVVSIAATPGSTVAIPGLERAPEPGEYWASPALARLIDEYPADQLKNRYGRFAGIIGDAALAGPETLLVVRGITPEAALQAADVQLASGFAGQAFMNPSYFIVSVIGGLAVLIPVLLLIGVVTRLGAAQRSEMFAVLRLIGTTPGLLVRLAVLETGATTLIGALAGAGLAWLASPLFARISLDGEPFFASDIRVGLPFVLVTVVALTVATMLVAWARASRSRVTGLGTSQELSEPRPRLWLLLVLPLGIVAMLVACLPSVHDGAFIVGFVLVLVGLVLAGPPLTFWASRLAARCCRGAAGVIAACRIRQHPRASFRAVGGLVVAVFVVSFFSAAITTAAADARGGAGGAGDVVILPGMGASGDIRVLNERSALFRQNVLQAHPASGGAEMNDTVAELLAELERVDGVTKAATAYFDEQPEGDTEGSAEGGSVVLRAQDVLVFGISPDEIGGSDGADAAVVEVPVDWLNGAVPPPGHEVAAEVRASSVTDLQALPPISILVATDGSPEALERVRTVMWASPVPFLFAPQTLAESAGTSSSDSTVQEYAFLGYIGILIATAVSGVAMAVSTIVGILDRRRTLALMRLAGMPAATIRRMISAETALPLFAVFFLSVALGFVTAEILLVGLTNGRRFVDLSLVDPSYYLVLAISLLIALLTLLATFPTAHRSTTLTATRFE